MKVLIVSTGVFPLPPEASGGTEYHIYYLAKHLARFGVEVHLVADVNDDAILQSNLIVHPINGFYFPSRNFTTWMLQHLIGGILTFKEALKQFLKGEQFDLIHVHGRIAALLTTLSVRNEPLVYTVHDEFPMDGISSSIERFIRCASYTNVEARIVRRANHVIAVSQNVKRELIKRWRIPEDKVTYIPHGVNTEFFKPAKKKQPIILFVGRLSNRKGVHQLVEAFAKANLDRYKLILVGDGEERMSIKRKVNELGIKNKVKMLGYIPVSLLQKLYAEAEILVLPSIVEPFGIVVLEAMASGCIPIVTKSAGVAELIENNKDGLLVEPNDVEALCYKIKYLINNSELRRIMAKNARKKAESSLSWENVAHRVLRVYGKLIKISER
jgi:1,4-alpha-glucan branching enzyme